MAIENSVSNDFLSMFLVSINVFVYRLSGVIMFPHRSGVLGAYCF